MGEVNRETSAEDGERWPEEIQKALDALNEQQRDFVLAYCGPARLNGKRAAIIAGYGTPTSSSNSLYSLASQTLRILKVQKARDLILDHYALSPAEIRAHLRQHVASTVDDVLGEDGRFDLAKARETGAIDVVRKLELVEETRVHKDGSSTTTVRHKLEMEPKQSALDKLARIQGQYKDTVVHEGNPDKPLVTPPTPQEKAAGYAELVTILRDLVPGAS